MRRNAILALLTLLFFSGQSRAPLTLTPSSGEAGTTVEVTVSAALAATAQVRFEPGGLIVSNLRNDARRQLQFTLRIPATATPGPYQFVYTPPASPLAPAPETRVTNAFTVTAARRPEPPVVRTITPNEGEAGAPPFAVTVRGANFRTGAQLEIRGAQVTGIVVSRDGTTIDARLSIPAGARADTVPVVVRNTDGTSNRSQRPEVTFRITSRPAPFVRQVQPASVAAGAKNVAVVITGANFARGARPSVADGSVSFADVLASGGSRIDAILSVAASTPPGPRAVLVTNPDGQSNASQSPPVFLTIQSPAPPSRQRPSAPPPAGVPPPVTSTQPPATSTQPPATSTQPPPPPTSTQPPPPPLVPKEPAPPPPSRPVTPPPVTITPVKPPPTERVLGPRIDRITPQNVNAGQRYDVQLSGKNLTANTTIAFARGIVLLELHVLSPTTATARLDVGPTVAPGTYAARAANETGANIGPGGIFVAATRADVRKTPGLPKLTLPRFKQPTGEILLDDPCDINQSMLLGEAQGIGEVWHCKDVPSLTDETTFLWHEVNPGIAKFFVLELVGVDDKVLFSAQTKQTHYHFSAMNLASLPRIEQKPLGSTTQEPKSAQPAVKAPENEQQYPTISQKRTRTNVPMAPNQIKNGSARSKKAGHHLGFGEVFWRVRGMSNKLDELTGMPLPEMIESERSTDRPILLPLPPNGLSCESGTQNSKIALMPRYQPQRPPALGTAGNGTPPYPPRPKPCEGNSTNICSGVDLAEFTEDSHINLQRLPFEMPQIGSFGGPFISFGNVWIDWGDGSEPEILTVKGNLAGTKQGPGLVYFYVPGADENRRIAHRYRNEDKDAEFVEYTVRIYALADPEATPPDAVAAVSARGARATGSVTRAARGEKTASNASYTPPTQTAGTQHLDPAALTAGMFTIACTKVKVWNVWEAGYDDPLHLLEARVVFSTETEPTARQDGPSSAAKSPASASPKPSDVRTAKTSPRTETSSGPTAQTNVKGPGLGHVPEISDCSTVFRAGARIDYYGHGYIALDWWLDEELIETTIVPGTLPRVSKADGEAGKHPHLRWMSSSLPPLLKAVPHRVRVIVRVVDAPSKKKQPPPGAAASKNEQVHYTTGPTQHARAGSPIFTEIHVVEPPWKRVESETRYYRVFDHKERGLPCTLRYQTAETGTFSITDISSFERHGSTEATATYSGKGALNIPLPSNNGNSSSPQGFPIEFSNWTLVAGGEDVFDVTNGTFDDATNLKLTALSFPFHVTHISLNPQRAALSGDVAAGDEKGFTTASKDPALWEFANAPITADGDFYATSAAKIAASLGASGFKISIDKAAIDFSRTAGSPPEESCGPALGGVLWQGIAIGGKLNPPYTLKLNNVALLKDYPFETWGIQPAGLSVKFDDAEYVHSLSASKVKLTVHGFKFAFCNGALGPTRFGLDLENAPLIVQKLTGTITLDDQAQLLPQFTLPQAIENDWGQVKVKITDAQFGFSAAANAYAISIKSHAWFRALNQPAFDHAYDGLLITLAGNVLNAEGKHYWGVPGAGTANLGGFPMTVTQLGVGNETNGDMWFGFTGDIEAGNEAPTAPNKEAKFLLKAGAPTASLHRRAPWQIASADLIYEPEDGDGSSASDLKVETFQLDWAFPPGSGTVQLVAECVWASAPNRYFMAGKGKVIVLDSFTAGAEVLFGRDEGASYWLLKGFYGPPVMTPLGSTPFGLARFAGGLSYNVPIDSFDRQDLTTVQKDGKKALQVYGAVDVGTYFDDGFALYGRGALTIRIAEDFGLRLSIMIWLLTADHDAAPMGEACVQYAGGAFDAGATAHYSLPAELIRIKAGQSGPDVCTQADTRMHFGGGDDWYIWLGQESSPLSIRFLWTEATGYMTIDKNGVIAKASVGVEKSWGFESSICDGWVRINSSLSGQGHLYFDPLKIDVTVGGQGSFEAGACGVSTGFGAAVTFTGSAPPLSLCGSVKVYVDLLVDDIDFSIYRCL